MIAIRVVIYWEGKDYNTAYVAAAIPAGAVIALCGLLMFRLILMAYALLVGTLIGMIAEAGLNNVFNTQDQHQCKPCIPPACPQKIFSLSFSLLFSFLLSQGGKLLTLLLGLLAAGLTLLNKPYVTP